MTITERIKQGRAIFAGEVDESQSDAQLLHRLEMAEKMLAKDRRERELLQAHRPSYAAGPTRSEVTLKSCCERDHDLARYIFAVLRSRGVEVPPSAWDESGNPK